MIFFISFFLVCEKKPAELKRASETFCSPLFLPPEKLLIASSRTTSFMNRWWCFSLCTYVQLCLLNLIMFFVLPSSERSSYYPSSLMMSGFEPPYERVHGAQALYGRCVFTVGVCGSAVRLMPCSYAASAIIMVWCGSICDARSYAS